MSTAEEAAQRRYSAALCAALTTTGAQAAASSAGYDGFQTVEAVAVGTVAAQAVTFTLEGSYDGTNFYTVAVQQIDATAAPAYSVSGLTITPGNGTLRHVYQVRDRYPLLRINPSANTLTGTGAGLTATYNALPV